MTSTPKWRMTDTHVYFVGGLFSQWAYTPFVGNLPTLAIENGQPHLRPGEELQFGSGEQYMMAAKAMIFNDLETLEKIMTVTEPSDMKRLGRQVKNYDDVVWRSVARQIVAIGNFYKFTQHVESRNFLEQAGDRYFVEGAIYDSIWGVKLRWDDDAIFDEKNWLGTNWLGDCIMWVRDQLKANAFVKNPWILRSQWIQ